MSWYAVDAIDDALDATKGFLFPFSLGRWARLVLVTLFVGGGGAGAQNALQFANSAGQFAGSGVRPGPPGGVGSTLAPLVGDVGASGRLLAPFGVIPAQVGQPLPGGVPFALGFVGLLVVAAIALLALVVTLASPVFEFVFVDAIDADEVRIRGPFGRHFWSGMRLLVFRLGATVLFLLPLVAVAAAAFLPAGGPLRLGVPVVLVLALLVFLWVLAFVLVMGFTTQFVVPVVYVDDAGILAGWSRVWSLLAGERTQTVVYLVVHLLVGIGVSLVQGLLGLVGLIPVAFVGLVVGLVAGAVVGGTVATNLGVGVGLLAGVAVGLPLYVVFVLLPLTVLTRTYLRTYELASLAGFDGRYDTLGRYRADDDVGGDRGDDGGPTRSDDGDGFDEFVPANDRFVDEETDDRPHTSGFRTGAELFAR